MNESGLSLTSFPPGLSIKQGKRQKVGGGGESHKIKDGIKDSFCVYLQHAKIAPTDFMQVT